MDIFFDPGDFDFIRPSEDMVTYFTGFSVKKKMAKYFEYCEALRDKVKDSDFFGFL